jgi:uncharacterized protein (TIGR04255 family)
MPFPEVKRVIYKRNPLDQVICQLRFPPILKIDNEIPDKFQDKIRNEFPEFTEKPEWRLNFSEGNNDQLPAELMQLLPHVSSKNYEFSAKNEIWKVNLTRTFVALTANKYERWESFKEILEIPFKALMDVYSPSYFSRIGLRYIDIIRRSKLELTDTPWNALLKPSITGLIGSEISDSVVNLQSINEIRLLDGSSKVRIATQLVKAQDDGEICFMIDSDFSTTIETNISGAFAKLDYFNTRASKLIQWSITKRLHQAMQPMEIL